MDMTGEYRIAAPRQRVWEGLNDPEVLRACIPGCESLDKTSDTEFTAKVKAKVGPVSASFAGKVALSDIDPPNGYRISGEGTGGAAGFAKGGATVSLAEDGPDVTVLTYTAEAQVGGKLAQIGSRLIQGTAKKMADDFFSRFAAAVGSPEPAGAPGTATGGIEAAGPGGTVHAAPGVAPGATGPAPADTGAHAAAMAAAGAPPPAGGAAYRPDGAAPPAGERPAASGLGGGVPQWVWIGVAAVAVVAALVLLTG
jgi:carbon monoxide dehydrogenase subunit G